MDLDSKRQDFERALLAVDQVGAERVLRDAQAALPAAALVEGLVVPTLEKLGRDWESGAIALSQIYMAGRICERLVDVVLPPASSERRRQPKTAIAVLEDYHMLGKRIVYSTLRAGGFELLDYGRREVNELVSRVAQDGIEILLVSALMLPSALRIKDLRAGLRAASLRVRIVVGGAPFRFDSELWKEVGADATSPDAAGAMAIVTAMAGGGA